MIVENPALLTSIHKYKSPEIRKYLFTEKRPNLGETPSDKNIEFLALMKPKCKNGHEFTRVKYDEKVHKEQPKCASKRSVMCPTILKGWVLNAWQ